jgi:hypothetical protein
MGKQRQRGGGMKIKALAAAALMIVLAQGMTTSCKKTEPGAVSPDQAARLQKSFTESKQAAAARVNGAEVSMFVLLREMNAIAPQYLARTQQRTPAIDEQIRKDALNNVIVQELAVQEASKAGLQAKPEAVDAELRKMKARLGSASAFEGYLAKNGLTEAELRKQIAQDALFELIAAREVDAKIKVTESDLKKRYQAEKSGLKDANHKELTFEAARGVLEERARAEASERRMREWEKELKKNAKIEIVKQDQKISPLTLPGK